MFQVNQDRFIKTVQVHWTGKCKIFFRSKLFGYLIQQFKSYFSFQKLIQLSIKLLTEWTFNNGGRGGSAGPLKRKMQDVFFRSKLFRYLIQQFKSYFSFQKLIQLSTKLLTEWTFNSGGGVAGVWSMYGLNYRVIIICWMKQNMDNWERNEFGGKETFR